MFLPAIEEVPRIQRVRAILLTQQNDLLFIKRIKPNKSAPYWVAPGGGVETHDPSLLAALHRELYEELGATCKVLRWGFMLKHEKAGKLLEEHFYICRLVHYDLRLRHGPEFEDPARGQYIPDVIALETQALSRLNIKTPELTDWLLKHLELLRTLR